MLHKMMLAAVFCVAILTPTAHAADQDLDRAEALFSAQKYDAALQIIQPLADTGDARAQTYLAKMYLGGYGVQKDISTGADLLRLAADQDYREAQFMLGVVYAAGEGGFPVDRVEALKWLIVAQAQDGLAYNMLVSAMSAGDIRRAEALADDWRERANRRKVQAASALSTGDKVSALVDLAGQGIAAAEHELGLLYAVGLPDAVSSKTVPGLLDLQPDHRKAAELFRRAALQGYAPAQARWGIALLDGIGVPVDHATAVEWLEKAAAQSELSAMLQLGDILAAGDVAPKDHRRAYTFYRNAARKGDTYAMEKLGRSYAEGTITEMDLELGYMWLSLASQKYQSEHVTYLSEEIDVLGASVAELMSQAQIDRAKEAAGRCLKTSYEKCERTWFGEWFWGWVQ